jgi:RNA polymerase sigma-70 factor (ECF subfamily)
VTADGDTLALSRFRGRRSASAFDGLYRRYTPSLYATALRITGDPASAADAVHDAWVRCIERFDAFEGRSSFRTWATGILINCIRESWRRDRRVEHLDTETASTNGVPPLPHNVDPLDLEAAIASLAPGFREVLILHDVEGFTHDEISDMLGIVPGTSKSQLSRARKKLLEQLGED